MITFNGRKCDLIVLEHLVGEEAVRSLWRKPHHDLSGWRGYWGLRGSVTAHLPALAPTFEAVRIERRSTLDNSHEGFYANHLADAYRDVQFTYALFKAYLASGEADRTFRDLQ
jgi:hypothetical protein